jgi:hypothetical protein
MTDDAFYFAFYLGVGLKQDRHFSLAYWMSCMISNVKLLHDPNKKVFEVTSSIPLLHYISRKIKGDSDLEWGEIYELTLERTI